MMGRNGRGRRRAKGGARALTARLGKGLSSGQIKVDTTEGLKWAMAVLHPCNENQTEAVAYPDSNHVPTHCTRMQRTVTISPPEGSCIGSTQPSLDACSWNLCIVTTPWPEYPWLICPTKGNDEPPELSYYVSKKGMYHGILNGDNPKNVMKWNEWYLYSFPNFMDAHKFGTTDDANDLRKKYQQIRVVAKGTTTYLNAARWVDGGRVICGQYPVATRFIDTFNPKSVSVDIEDLCDKIIKRLCVDTSKGGFTPEEIRRITEHNHEVKVQAQLRADAKTTVNSSVADNVAYTATNTAKTTVNSQSQRYNFNLTGPIDVVTKVEPDITELRVDLSKGTIAGSLEHEHHMGPITIDASQVRAATKHYHKMDPFGVDEKKVKPMIYHTHNIDKQPTSGPYFSSNNPTFVYATKPDGSDPETGYEITNSNLPGLHSEGNHPTDKQLVANPLSLKGAIEVDGALPIKATSKVTHSLTGYVQPNVQSTATTTVATQLTKTGAVKVNNKATTDVDLSGDFVTEVSRPVYSQQLSYDYDGDECIQAAGCGRLTKDSNSKVDNIKLVRDGEVVDMPDWQVSDPPCSENMLFYGDPKATTWEARKGTYQVMRIVKNDLADCNTGYATFYSLKDATDKSVQPENYEGTFDVNIEGTGTWGVAYYRNISLFTSVTAKCVQYTQGVVNPVGPFANLTPHTADPDLSAIELVAEEQRRLAHAYPANYNDLGEIMGQIFKVAKSIGRAVNAAAGELGDVPVVGGIAQGLKSLLSGLGLG